MDPLHARYPFLAAARESVREADIGLVAIVTGDERHPAVERGVERVRRALIDGTVRPDAEDGRRWNPRAELLSYPVARVLVSLVDAPGAVEKYASAEAGTAYERFTDDFRNPDDGLKSTADKAISLDALLAEFDLSGDVAETPEGDGYRIAVGKYLTLSSNLDGESWTLAARQLADGTVKITETELHELLREAVRQRVAAGLPTAVPDEIREGLTDEVARLEDTFSEVDISPDIDVLAPECFPPCVASLMERAQAGENLSDHAEFALVSFLTSANADTDELLALCGVDSDTAATAVRYRADRVGDESGAQYAPPSCETMQAYEECPVVDEEDPTADARCDSISHPLSYYEDALADAESVSE
ncbi:DNA primase large subunit PriL [Halorussus sp. MSC15.2]|uniref:DNA primase large subunit PriL n=1 Tax=Halorussus sp. MSC15.2 TaxID=2283638 RepID=UPI0013D2EF93|nr:DNA primase large subunit PriL [Halorussus sp. MSC15.2]NEU55469.1 DNA primase large subunit PriL [Halorussus sp. MSC15.2]